jgi:hypothetical protein
MRESTPGTLLAARLRCQPGLQPGPPASDLEEGRLRTIDVSTQTLSRPSTTAVGGRVARAGLAILLFLQAAILGLWALRWASDELSQRGVFHVPYPAWAGVALFIVLFGGAVRATLIAGVALWQCAWRREGRIGPTKINAAWTAVVVNAAFVPGLALVATLAGPSPKTVDVESLFWFVVWGGAIAACLAFFALRPPLRWAGWRPVAKAAVVCLVLLVGAGIMFRDQRVGFANSLPAFFFPGTNSAAVCHGAPDEGCGARAARSADGLVAWVPAPPEFSVDPSQESMIVSGHRVHETLESVPDGALVRLDSGVPAGPDELCGSGDCVHRRTVRVGRRMVTVRSGVTEGTGSFAVTSWTRGGSRFSLAAVDPARPVDLIWFTSVLRSVRYATP